MINWLKKFLSCEPLISLKPRRRHHNAIHRDFLTVAQRWQLIGGRLRDVLNRLKCYGGE